MMRGGELRPVSLATEASVIAAGGGATRASGGVDFSIHSRIDIFWRGIGVEQFAPQLKAP